MSAALANIIWRSANNVQMRFEVFYVRLEYLLDSSRLLAMVKSNHLTQVITKVLGQETEGLFCLIDKVLVKGVHFV